MRGARAGAVALLLAAGLMGSTGALAAPVGATRALAAPVVARDARIAGRVLLCNSPGHCMTRKFTVSAIDSAGDKVASTSTMGVHNAYRLRVAPGAYRLVAKSHGLVCEGTATAAAHKTTRTNITCLVP